MLYGIQWQHSHYCLRSNLLKKEKYNKKQNKHKLKARGRTCKQISTLNKQPHLIIPQNVEGGGSNKQLIKTMSIEFHFHFGKGKRLPTDGRVSFAYNKKQFREYRHDV